MQTLWTVEPHAHTAQVSLCAKLSAAQMVQQIKAVSYEAVVVTDHYTPEMFELHRRGNDYVRQLENAFMRGYRLAREEGQRIGVHVFCGMEIRISCGPEDYLVYGVTFDELKDLGCLAFLTLDELSRAVRSTKHGVIIQAHPFRSYLNCQPALYLDGVEVHNANPRHDSRNHLALAFAQQNKLLMTAGSDVHQMGDAGSTGVQCPPFDDMPQFAQMLKNGQVRLL